MSKEEDKIKKYAYILGKRGGQKTAQIKDHMKNISQMGVEARKNKAKNKALNDLSTDK